MNPYRDKIEDNILSGKTGGQSDIDDLVNDLTKTKKILKNKRIDEHNRRKKTIKDLKRANALLKENVNITEQIYNKMEVYDKLERGEYVNINYSEGENALKLKKPKPKGFGKSFLFCNHSQKPSNVLLNRARILTMWFMS